MSQKSEGTSRELARVIETLSSSDIIGALSNMANLGESLERGSMDYSPEEAGTIIKLQSERIARLLDTLLLTQQIEDGRLEVSSRPLTLRPILEDTVAGLSPLSEKYATKVRLGRKQKLRPVLVDIKLVGPVISNALEGVIRTTVSKKVKVDTVSHEDQLFVHITDKDASFENQADGTSRGKAGSSHAIAIPSFYVANSLLTAMGGELRIDGSKNRRHIDLIFPHSVQLAMDLK